MRNKDVRALFKAATGRVAIQVLIIIQFGYSDNHACQSLGRVHIVTLHWSAYSRWTVTVRTVRKTGNLLLTQVAVFADLGDRGFRINWYILFIANSWLTVDNWDV